METTRLQPPFQTSPCPLQRGRKLPREKAVDARSGGEEICFHHNINILRFLTFVRNDNFSNDDTVSGGETTAVMAHTCAGGGDNVELLTNRMIYIGTRLWGATVFANGGISDQRVGRWGPMGPVPFCAG